MCVGIEREGNSRHARYVLYHLTQHLVFTLITLDRFILFLPFVIFVYPDHYAFNVWPYVYIVPRPLNILAGLSRPQIPGGDLAPSLPVCMVTKWRDMGSFWASREGDGVHIYG